MTLSESLAPRSVAALDIVQEILGTLVARYRKDEVLTAVRQIPAREAKFRPIPGWVTSACLRRTGRRGFKNCTHTRLSQPS